MSEAVRGVVVCHGGLSSALVAAVEEISGRTDRLVAVSNLGCDRDSLEQRIVDAIAGAPAVVFVDMPSGSCLFAAMHRLRGEPNVKVVTGVNLAMLIDFVFHADDGPTEAAARAVVTGERAIRIP